MYARAGVFTKKELRQWKQTNKYKIADIFRTRDYYHRVVYTVYVWKE